MYKTKDYHNVISQYGETSQKRWEMIRKLSNDFTKENKTALEMDKLLFEKLNEELKDKFKLTGKNVFDEENQALESAMQLIEDDVLAGRTVQQIKKSKLFFKDANDDVYIKGGKVYVKMLSGKKVDYSFTVHYLYNEVMGEHGRSYESNLLDKKTTKAKRVTSTIKRPKINYEKAKKVERIEEEVKFIKRYLMMHKKRVSQKQLLNLLNGLQRAILERRIRKTSKYSDEIKYMQEKLVGVLNYMQKNRKAEMDVELEKKTFDSFSAIAGSETVRVSTNLLKRYVGIQGKEIDKQKAQKLIKAMERAAEGQKVDGDDPYFDQLTTVYNSLHDFVAKAKTGDKLELHENTLNGIESLLGCIGNPDCGCEDDELNGLETDEETMQPKSQQNLMNSMDFANLEFETLGFDGKWLNLIGDPAQGFTAMVFGKPKMGKSFLCVDFAGYLARHHGRTLYVAREEKLDKTLQDKLKSKEVKHPMLDVSDFLPEDLSEYDFIILDSVNTLNLSPEDLRALKEQYPDKSFIYIFQTTKEGNFRGANTFQHDVDVVIEIPERGKAVQFGRFNQGGEMEIFEQAA